MSPAASKQPESRPRAVMHVDLDGASDIYRSHGWEHPWANDLLFESGMRHLLDFLDDNRLQATLFAISSSLDDPRKRLLLEEAVGRGHEIASHTVSHGDLRKLGTAEKRRELGVSRERLEKELQTPVRGFRAPGYTIDREAFEVLADLGYAWDSSAFPEARWAEALGVDRAALMRPGHPIAGCPLKELPLPAFRPLPVPWSPSYALLLGHGYFRLGLARQLRSGGPLAFLLHLTDLADPLPRERTPSWRARTFTLSLRSAAAKRRGCQAMVERVGMHFDWTTTSQLLDFS